MVAICSELGLDMAEVMRAKEWWMEAWTIEEEEMLCEAR